MRSSLLLLASCGRIAFDSSSDATTPTGDGDAVDDARVDDARVTDAQQIACGPVNCGVAARFMVCNGRCITICDELATQAFARQQCLFWGGDLLTVRDAADNACAASLDTINAAWIGYVQASPALGLSTDWSWIGGAPSPYTNWAPGEPQDLDNIEDAEEQCSLMFDDGTWVDTGCNGTWGSLCSR